VADPSFKILDVARVADPSFSDVAGVEVVVTQVRVYQDGSVTYGTGSLADESAGGIYDEASLMPTGTVASVEDFRVPGPFLDRELVEVSGDCPDIEVRGQVGEIDGSYSGAEGALLLGVWFETLHEGRVIDPRLLRSTGRRANPPRVPHHAGSKLVGEDGMVRGETTYTIVDDIAQYL
jgi:hypothetical protein